MLQGYFYTTIHKAKWHSYYKNHAKVLVKFEIHTCLLSANNINSIFQNTL